MDAANPNISTSEAIQEELDVTNLLDNIGKEVTVETNNNFNLHDNSALEGAVALNFFDGLLSEETPITEAEEVVVIAENISMTPNSSTSDILVGQRNPDVINTNNDTSNSGDDSEVPIKRAKKGMAVKQNWIRTRNKIKRMKGEEYQGVKNDGASYKQNKDRTARHIGHPCTSNKCGPNSQHGCRKITEDDRQHIFQRFWKTMNWGQRKVYVSSLVDMITPKQKTTEGDSRRKYTMKYHLKVHDVRIPVCKKMFLNTLKIGEWSVHSWVKGGSHGMHVGSRAEPQKKKLEDVNKRATAQQFLQSLPTMPSHYCRAQTEKQYLEPIIGTHNKLYKVFKDYCSTNSKPFASKRVLAEEFRIQNYAFFQPKKDQCDLCSSYTLGNASEEIYREHINRKDSARAEKAKDKEEAKQGTGTFVATMDVQAVLLAPSLLASAVYYRTKLACHNFTVYDLGTSNVVCYFWHEAEGNLTANTFASCITNYLKDIITSHNVQTLILYSDGCGYQNRNKTLSNALLHFAIQNNVTLIQKYLVKGHTQMEVDAAHSLVERKLKNKEIYVPANYIDVMKMARQNNPFKVKYITHDFFIDFADVACYDSIRPGKKEGDPQVHDLSALKYSPCGSISYKLSFDQDWEILPQRRRQVETGPKQLHGSSLKIKQSKFKHLQELKPFIPRDYHSFYDNLPH